MDFGKSTSSNAGEGAFAPLVFTIPDRLRPSWSQLPALARLVTDRLGNTLVRWPVLGPAFRSAAVCLNWCTLAAGHGAGWVTACGTDAVLWLRPAHPPGTPLTTRLREHVVRSAALAPALLASATLIMSIVVAATPAGGVLLLLGLTLGAWWALGALAILRRGTSAKATGRHERNLVRRPGIRLVVACGLAASAVPQTPHAATSMLLAMRRTADEQHLTVLAGAATKQLAAQYQRHGFVRLRAGDRHLLRAPQHVRSAASSTPTPSVLPPDGR